MTESKRVSGERVEVAFNGPVGGVGAWMLAGTSGHTFEALGTEALKRVHEENPPR